MRSMTGFGIGHAALGSGRLSIEIKSLNHRYLDVRVRVPAELGDYGFFLEHLARTKLSRGRFDVQLRIEGPALAPPTLDVDRVRSLYGQLVSLKDELCPTSDVSLSALAALPSLYVQSSEINGERVRDAVGIAFEAACHALDAMRDAEGTRLRTTLAGLLARAVELTAQCEGRGAETIVGHRERLRERVAKLVDDAATVLDPARLELEVALVAERSDATEEIARLRSHFAMFGELLSSREATGRRLDFLLQEIARETNTLGAKSQDATLSHLVVEMKAEAERMREQVQNVE